MLRVFFVICFFGFVSDLFSQPPRKMKYTRTAYSSFSVEPLINHYDLDGYPGIARWSDDNYILEIVNKLIDKILSKKTRDSLSLGTGYTLTLNKNGDVINCRFIFNYKDSTLISDSQFFELYNSFMKIRFDTNKVKIESSYIQGSKSGNYAYINGSLRSKEAQVKINLIRKKTPRKIP
jgi:hypothetical protein